MDLDYRMRLSAYLAMCINKSQPLLACEGQCVLMKKLEDKAAQETEKNLVSYEYSTLYVHKEHLAFSPQQPDTQTGQSHFTPYLLGDGFEYNALLYRPPIG